jgi:hypothetical protein
MLDFCDSSFFHKRGKISVDDRFGGPNYKPVVWMVATE